MPAGSHLTYPELRRRMAMLSPVHEAINTVVLGLESPEAFDSFVADLRNLLKVYREPFDEPPDAL